MRDANHTDSVADWIDGIARTCRETIRDSTLGHRESLDELAQIWNDCRCAGWDGYGAEPVEQSTVRAAYELITSLPLGFPRPTIGAEPDGQITVEWRTSPQSVLSVSVDPSGFLHYAGILGTRKRFGTLDSFSALPDELVRLVRETEQASGVSSEFVRYKSGLFDWNRAV